MDTTLCILYFIFTIIKNNRCQENFTFQYFKLYNKRSHDPRSRNPSSAESLDAPPARPVRAHG
jgi:hypothetical protein